MQTLSYQEISQISGGFSLQKITDMGGKGIVCGAMLAGLVIFVPAITVFGAASTSMLFKGAIIFGGVEVLFETKDSIQNYLHS